MDGVLRRDGAMRMEAGNVAVPQHKLYGGAIADPMVRK